VDGTVGDLGSVVLDERRKLGSDGFVTVVVHLNLDRGLLLRGPEVVSRGWVEQPALLAHEARVELAGPGDAGSSERGLGELLAAGLAPGSLITAVTVDPSGSTAVSRTGRTPADVPIVAAYGRRTDGFVAMALTGVADHPVLVDVYDPTAGLDPAGDFRGSREYRLHLAATLTARVMQELYP